MKRFLFLLTLGLLVVLSSCSDDDGEASVGLTGATNYDGEAISISDGLFGEFAEDGAYAATFFLADAPLSFDEDTEAATFQGEVLISVVIGVEGDSFQPGTYPIEFNSSSSRIAIVFVTTIADNQVDTTLDAATGGTVNITGSGNSYTITFDLTFESELELTGTASGGFEIIDVSNLE